MIKATEARANVNLHYEEETRKVEEKLNPIIEAMGRSIEIHSKLGITHIDFMPYEKSRFPSSLELEQASKIMERILKENGYKITRNNWSENILKVEW